MSDVQDIRAALFSPCETRADLSRWIRVFLDIRLPDQTVSEESTSNPMDAIWEMYDRLRRNSLEGFERVMMYASRFGGKTLSASILECLILLHFNRNIAHLAASKHQSSKAQEYLKGFFRRPHLRDFVEGDNQSELIVVSYRADGKYLNQKEFSTLPAGNPFIRQENYARIVVLTMSGANGEHAEVMVIDELDVIPRANLPAYEQAKSIPVSRTGLLPMTLLTSTRKSRIGKVQNEIDNAEKTGLVTRHWNVIDVTEPCPPSRHRPLEPREKFWVNDADVKHITEADYGVLPEVEQKRYYDVQGFAGCRKCRLFPACKGRLATHQKGEAGKTALLVPITDVISKFRGASPEYITTEYLCRKPDTSGMVYPRLNREVHFKTPEQIAAMVDASGVPVPGVSDKGTLIRWLQARGAKFVSGMDFGFTHLFAVVTAAIWGRYCFVIDVVARAELELDDKIDACQHLKALEPSIYGDPEAPDNIKTFRRKGFKMKDWTKFPGSVRAGIEVVRNKIYTTGYGASLFFMTGDPLVELLYKHMESYAFETDAAGEFTETPDETNDDLPDGLRYLVMNAFASKGVLKDAGARPPVTESAAPPPNPTGIVQQQWMVDIVRQATGETPAGPEAQKTVTVKKGGFVWSG